MQARLFLLTILIVAGSASAQALTYRQKQALGRMQSSVKYLEDRVLPKYRDTKWLDQGVWTVPELNKHIEATNNAFKKLNDAIIYLNKAGCHTGQPEVKALVERIESGRNLLRKAANHLQVVAKRASAAGSASTYKDYKADRERAGKIADMFQIHDLMTQADEVAAVGKEFRNAARWIENREKFYQPFFQQGTPAAKELDNALKRGRSVLSRFRKNAQTFINEAPKAIDRELKEGERILATAIAQTKPLFLDGGVKQNIDLVRQRLGVLTALLGSKQPVWLESARTRHAALVKGRREAAITMEAQIIANRRAPRDRYAGEDREDLRKRVHAAWREAHPKDRILAVRFPTNGWQRRKRARWVGDSWIFSDASWIQVRVAVQVNPERVALHIAHVNKDNQTGSITTNVEKDPQFHAVDEMLRKNWK